MAAARSSCDRRRTCLPNKQVEGRHLTHGMDGGLCSSPSQVALHRQLADSRILSDESVQVSCACIASLFSSYIASTHHCNIRDCSG